MPPSRADARRNRERILDAAIGMFAVNRGLGTLDQVAAAAGVGKGTVYRHFVNREALMEAVALRQFDELRERADQALEPSQEPVEAFVALVRDILTYNRERGLYLEVVRAGSMPSKIVAAQAHMREPLAVCMDRCRAHGVISDDVDSYDLFVQIGGSSMRLSVVDAPPQRWHRALVLILRAVGFPEERLASVVSNPSTVTVKPPG